MKAFAQLYERLDESTSTTHKVACMASYFLQARHEDAAWAVYFLVGGKPKRAVPTSTLRQVAMEASGLSEWLFEECYQAVGDLAETISLVLPNAQTPVGDCLAPEDADLAWWVENRVLPLRDMQNDARIPSIKATWMALSSRERFLFVKLVGGGFRVGVSKLLVTRALAKATGHDPKLLATRLMGYADNSHLPTGESFVRLISKEDVDAAKRVGQPLPFFLAHPLQQQPDTLGSISDWLVEWKFDGIRAQVVKDAGEIYIWSRGEELVTAQFPELHEAFATWPDGTIADGEILVWREGNVPAPFNDLQIRLNRKQVTKKLRLDNPVVFLTYDFLKQAGELLTPLPQRQRRARLERFFDEQQAVSNGRLKLSPLVQAKDWSNLSELLAESRARGVEGFMLKHTDSLYGVGRTRTDGTWWKWKVEPMTADCVLVYAQRGHGRRASLYTDYTFAVWDRPPANRAEAMAVVEAIARGEKIQDTTAAGLPCLVPFAKAYSGLTDDEFKRVDKEIRKNTLDKFGPVRTVKPTLVFELGFEAIGLSKRHKSGVAVRFPRMLRIRDDKPLHEADTLDSLLALLPKATA